MILLTLPWSEQRVCTGAYEHVLTQDIRLIDNMISLKQYKLLVHNKIQTTALPEHNISNCIHASHLANNISHQYTVF